MIIQDSKPYPRYYPSPATRSQVYRVQHPNATPEWQFIDDIPHDWARSGQFATEQQLAAQVAMNPFESLDRVSPAMHHNTEAQQNCLRALEENRDAG